MNKKQYYEAIKEYNLLVKNKEFNPVFFTKENQDRLENLREMLLYKVRSMDDMITLAAYSGPSDKSLRNLRILKCRLEVSKRLEKEYYENSWHEELWFGFFTKNQILIGGVICFVILFIRHLMLWL